MRNITEKPEIQDFTGTHRKRYQQKTYNPILFGGLNMKTSSIKTGNNKPSPIYVQYNDKKALKFLSETCKVRKVVPGIGITKGNIVDMVGNAPEENSNFL